jgi:Domain of unknown function (DUF6378)
MNCPSGAHALIELIEEAPLKTNVLQEADRLVNGKRQADYGHPLDNWTQTAKLWSAYLGIEITAEQGVDMMMLAKLSRLSQSPTHRDSLVDLPGYALVREMISEERTRRADERLRAEHGVIS